MGKGNGNGRKADSFGFTSFLWRLVASLIMVVATYNPAGLSYFHWVSTAFTESRMGAVHFFVGVVLLIGWTIFWVATSRSLGTLGTILGAALIGTGIWVLAQAGLVHADSRNAILWLSLIALAILLAIGLSWSHVWRRLSGQLEVDEVDG